MEFLELAVLHDDIAEFDVEVVALKYAQARHGADAAVSARLEALGLDINAVAPPIDSYVCVDSLGSIQAGQIVFVGSPGLSRLRYREIRQLMSRTMEVLSETKASDAHTLATTIHGVGYGLDEAAAFLAQMAGLLDSFRSGRFSQSLAGITIIEKDAERARRLRLLLELRLAGEPYAARTATGTAFKLDLKSIACRRSTEENR